MNAENGNLTTITIWLYAGADGQTIKTLIYSDNAGSPDVLLGTSEEKVSAVDFPSTTKSEVAFAFSPTIPLTSGLYYWIGYGYEDITADVLWFYYDAGVANQLAFNDDVYLGGFASPFGAHSHQNWAMAVYGTYNLVSATKPSGGSAVMAMMMNSKKWL